MEIVLGKTAGFCYGVKRAVSGAEEELKEKKSVFCLGEIVHNKNVIDNLKNKGIKFINNIEEASGKTIIRAHGVEKKIYEQAKDMNIELKDLTCPKVLKIHEIAEEYAKKEYFIIIIGNEKHPEVIGIKSFCSDSSFIINDEKDIEKAIQCIEYSQFKNILIISQTTYNSKKFDEIVKNIKEKSNTKNWQIQVKKTICPATEMRQIETEEIAKEVDYMIIIGDKKSSNSNKLYEIATKYCSNAIFIENYKNLNKNALKQINKVGIMAGASTPKEDIKKVMEILLFKL